MKHAEGRCFAKADAVANVHGRQPTGVSIQLIDESDVPILTFNVKFNAQR